MAILYSLYGYPVYVLYGYPVAILNIQVHDHYMLAFKKSTFNTLKEIAESSQ